jgi:hypothetical protein
MRLFNNLSTDCGEIFLIALKSLKNQLTYYELQINKIQTTCGGAIRQANGP